MRAILSPASMAKQIEALSAGAFLRNPLDLLDDALSLIRPPEKISTVECAEKYRWIRTAKGDGRRLWSRSLTPYNVGVMDALDDPAVQEVIVPKPGRTGGTVAFENFAFKMMRFGPMGDIGWYLKSGSEVTAYTSKGFKELFDLHPEIQAKVGKERSDDKLSHKTVDGRTVDVLQANPTTFTNRQFYFMVGDEIDTYQPRICDSFLEQTRIRGRALGSDRKVGMASHPDRGWTTGIASAWMGSSRGIYVMPCAECDRWGSPWPTKFWPDVPRFRIWYEKAEQGTDKDVRTDLATRTAAMACPHCGALLDDKQRHAMIDLGEWMHRGQTLDVVAGICGERDSTSSMGFWVHGLMSKMITNAELARDLEAATAHYDETRKVDRLREVTAKVFGEVFEGVGSNGAVDSGELQKRRAAQSESGRGFPVGSVPPEVLFLTQSIDVGHSRFDLGTWGWDREGRSWLIDRVVIRQRIWEDGLARDLRPAERIEDWAVLEPYIDRKVPLLGDDHLGLPVAMTGIDAGDGNVTWKAYEFCRRMDGRRWGEFRAVRVIKGAARPTAPEIPASGTSISKDQNGREVHPIIRLYSLGVHRLKEQAVERLAVHDDGPGQCFFADGIGRRHFDEFFGERLIGGKWERHGDNESLDLFAYAEALRLMLLPDRKGIVWNDPERRPIWARPQPLFPEGGDPADRGQGVAPTKTVKKSIFDLHRETEQGTE